MTSVTTRFIFIYLAEPKPMIMNTFSLLFAMLLTGSCLFSQNGYTPETLEKIREVENNITGNVIVNQEAPRTIEEQMKHYGIKGMSIAVIHNYRIDWAKGYGWADETEKRPVTPETLFEPGSISKSLNAVGILKLAQEKKLDLYTDINTYLRSWKFPYDSLSKGKKITLADILSHQAGLSVHGFPGHSITGDIPTIYQVLDGQAPALTPAVRSEFEPGLKFQYSGGGTSISQVILTDITGQPYDQWMYEQVLQPIGMINSSYSWPKPGINPERYATAYHADGTPVYNKFHVYPEQAAAGLWMTPSDLCRYIIDMQLAYKGGKSAVLDAEMVKLHLTPYNNGPAAMGTFIDNLDGATYFQHGAGNDGFCGQFFASLEEGNGVVIFLNTENFSLVFDVINSVAKAYDWKNFYHEPKRKNTEPVITVPDNVLDTYTGIYFFDDQWASVERKDGKLCFYTDGTYADMYFTSETTFFNREFAAVKAFRKDQKGKVCGYTRVVEGKTLADAQKAGNIQKLVRPLSNLEEVGWYLIGKRKYPEAISYLERGVELYPEDLNARLNLAHAYLFNNNYKKAMAIYQANKDRKIQGNYTWTDGLKNDYIYFKEHQYDVSAFERLFNDLGIEKPKGY